MHTSRDEAALHPLPTMPPGSRRRAGGDAVLQAYIQFLVERRWNTSWRLSQGLDSVERGYPALLDRILEAARGGRGAHLLTARSRRIITSWREGRMADSLRHGNAWPHATAGEPQPAPNRPQTPPGNAGGEEGTTQPPEISGAASTPPGLAVEDTASFLPPEPAPDTPVEEEEARAHTIHLLGEAQRIEISSEEETPVDRSTRNV